MAVSGDDLAGLEYRPDVLLDLLVGRVGADGLLHAEDEAEDLLVSETVEGTGETTEGGRVREEGVGEGGSNKVCDELARDGAQTAGNVRVAWAETLPPSWSAGTGSAVRDRSSARDVLWRAL